MKAFVIFRDRLSYLGQCIAALQTANLEVHVVDHDSTYPPALNWLYDADVRVHRLVNQHPQDLWKWTGLHRLVGDTEPYIVTDCDVIPTAPYDWVTELKMLLELNPDRNKVGMSLRLDLPDHYQHRQKVLEWERQHWGHPLGTGPGGEPLYGAAVDTTLAMYQPLSKYPTFALGPAMRTGHPYVAQHLSWYEDSSNPSDEQVWYEKHMNRDYSHWIAPERYA